LSRQSSLQAKAAESIWAGVLTSSAPRQRMRDKNFNEIRSAKCNPVSAQTTTFWATFPMKVLAVFPNTKSKKNNSCVSQKYTENFSTAFLNRIMLNLNYRNKHQTFICK
jgi:hypothetical protein